MKVIRTDQEPARPVTLEGASGVTLRVLIGPEDGSPTFAMRLFEIEPGGHTAQHAHSFEHEIIVQAGSGTLWTPEREYPLELGVVALVPSGQEHQFRAGKNGMAMFCMVPNHGHVHPAPPERDSL